MNEMNFDGIDSLDEYQQWAHRTANYPEPGQIRGDFYLVSKLAGEAGEVAEKFGKQIRDKQYDVSEGDFQEGVKKELGDVLWYVQEIAGRFGWDLSDVARTNLVKLYSRKARGVLGGSGDDR